MKHAEKFDVNAEADAKAQLEVATLALQDASKQAEDTTSQKQSTAATEKTMVAAAKDAVALSEAKAAAVAEVQKRLHAANGEFNGAEQTIEAAEAKDFIVVVEEAKNNKGDGYECRAREVSMSVLQAKQLRS